MTKFKFTTLAICASAAALGSALPARAADKMGQPQMCIMSNYIAETPVIDSRTILVRMNPGRGYKRIELASECNSLADSKSPDGRGLGFDTTVNRLCVQDTLTAREDSGQACVISKIITIDADEAQELLLRRR